MKVLVLGAAGFLGQHVVDALRDHGVEPLCGRRARTNVLPLRGRRVALVQADLDRPDELVAAMRDVDVVVHCAGHYPRHALDRVGAFETGMRQTRNVLDAAERAGLGRLVYVSSTATVAPAPGLADESSTFPRAPGIGVYHDLKWTMEAAFLADPRVVVACPSALIGPWDWRVGTCALLVGVARGMDPPHPDGWVSIVDAGDAAFGIARLALVADPPRRVLLAPPALRLHALFETLAVRYAVAPPSPALSPDDAVRLADAQEAAWVAGGPRPTLARELADLVISGVPVTSRLAEERLGVRFRPLDETLDRFDAWARQVRLVPPLPQEASP